MAFDSGKTFFPDDLPTAPGCYFKKFTAPRSTTLDNITKDIFDRLNRRKNFTVIQMETHKSGETYFRTIVYKIG